MDRMYALGAFLGYPECCVKEFTENFIPIFLRDPIVQIAVVNGFVPCSCHAQQLNRGYITYEELINANRKASVPFKKEHTKEEEVQIDEEIHKFLGV